MTDSKAKLDNGDQKKWLKNEAKLKQPWHKICIDMKNISRAERKKNEKKKKQKTGY